MLFCDTQYLSVQLCTHYQWSCVFSQTLPGISVMLHSLQRSPVVPPWAKRDCPPECRWLVAQYNRVRGDFSAEAHYGLSHYGRKPNTTSGSRWSKGKANINSYDCWLYSETLCNELACFFCGLPSSQNYVLHVEQFNSSTILMFSKTCQLWIHRSMIFNVASSLPSLSSVSLLCQLGVGWAVIENNLWVCTCFSKHQNHDECRDILTLHRTPSYRHKKTPNQPKTQKRHRDFT